MDLKWRTCVDRLLRSWTGFQLAITMQSGGPNTYEKSQWFLQELCDFVLHQKDLEEDELADWINQILYNDFDLVLEDESTDWIAESLIKCRRWFESDETQLNGFLSSLPSEASVQQAANQSKTIDSDASDFEEEINVDNTGDLSSIQYSKTRQPRMVTDEDGWTTVLSRK